MRLLQGLDDPRLLSSALIGYHADHWRWRIGAYRVVARIEDKRIVIVVVRARSCQYRYGQAYLRI